MQSPAAAAAEAADADAGEPLAAGDAFAAEALEGGGALSPLSLNDEADLFGDGEDSMGSHD